MKKTTVSSNRVNNANVGCHDPGICSQVASLKTCVNAILDVVLGNSGVVVFQVTEDTGYDGFEISQDVSLMVRAGRKHAATLPGTMFAYDRRVWDVPACARVTVTLVNDDQVRHQWMLHGLPRYLYPEGMFHLEVSGGGKETGTFIVPSSPKTYLVHCDVPQHAEKGMKGELRVAGGDEGVSFHEHGKPARARLGLLPGRHQIGQVHPAFQRHQRYVLAEVHDVAGQPPR